MVFYRWANLTKPSRTRSGPYVVHTFSNMSTLDEKKKRCPYKHLSKMEIHIDIDITSNTTPVVEEVLRCFT